MALARALHNYLKQAMDLHQAGNLDRAMQMYRDVLVQDPKQADALHLLGAAEWQKGNLEEAETLIRRAIAVWDEDAGYFSDLGHVLHAKSDLAGAIAAYKEALAIDPKQPHALKGLADTYGHHAFELAKQFRWDEAEAAYRALLEIRPDDAGALNNLAELYQHAGEREKACALYTGALNAKPDFHVLRANRAICQLGLNRLQEGWQDLADSVPGWLPRVDKRENLPWLLLPLWDGGDLTGKKILIWGDQGIGDEVLFASMLPDLIARGAQVTVECMDRLAPIFARSFPMAVIALRRPRPVIGAEFDCQAPGLWLGRWLRADFESFPARASYLKADADRTAALRARYQAFGKKHIVGLAWHSISGGRAEQRRISLMELAAALPRADTLFIDLQYGDHQAEREDAGRALPDFTFFHDAEIDQLKDMDAFAAQMAACDRIVTIGNTTAHMAGALGVPATVLLPHAGLTWYWFEERLNSPWYPTLTILRKPLDGDWGGVLRGMGLNGV